MPETLTYVDVLLSWSRAFAGATAVLKRGDDATGWTEVGRTSGTEFTARGLNPERAYTFAAAEVAPDSAGGGLNGRSPGKEKAPNPWRKDSLNLTEQGRIRRADPERAKRLQAEARGR